MKLILFLSLVLCCGLLSSAEKEYYRIDGTRANTLNPGLYIVRRGNSAHKVIIY